MIVSKETDNVLATETITVGQYEFKKLEHLKYRGTIVTQKNERHIESQQKIKMRYKCFYVLKQLLRSRILLKEVRIQLYVTIIRSVVMCSSKCWTLRKTDCISLRGKCYAKYMEPIYDQEIQGLGKRHDKELMKIFDTPSIGNKIKRSK